MREEEEEEEQAKGSWRWRRELAWRRPGGGNQGEEGVDTARGVSVRTVHTRRTPGGPDGCRWSIWANHIQHIKRYILLVKQHPPIFFVSCKVLYKSRYVIWL